MKDLFTMKKTLHFLLVIFITANDQCMLRTFTDFQEDDDVLYELADGLNPGDEPSINNQQNFIAEPELEGDETQTNLPFEGVESNEKDTKQNESSCKANNGGSDNYKASFVQEESMPGVIESVASEKLAVVFNSHSNTLSYLKSYFKRLFGEFCCVRDGYHSLPQNLLFAIFNGLPGIDSIKLDCISGSRQMFRKRVCPVLYAEVKGKAPFLTCVKKAAVFTDGNDIRIHHIHIKPAKYHTREKWDLFLNKVLRCKNENPGFLEKIVRESVVTEHLSDENNGSDLKKAILEGCLSSDFNNITVSVPDANILGGFPEECFVCDYPFEISSSDDNKAKEREQICYFPICASEEEGLSGVFTTTGWMKKN